MISEVSLERVYLATGSTDLRKSIDGLSVLVKEGFQLDPFYPCLFVFCNRNRDKLKILQWEHNGFWLHYRRLEKGKFQWPQKDGAGVTTISRRELRWLLDGLRKRKIKPALLARGVLFYAYDERLGILAIDSENPWLFSGVNCGCSQREYPVGRRKRRFNH